MLGDHFGEHVAERYDEWVAERFETAAVEPVVDFLAAPAGDGAALARHRHRPHRAAACAALGGPSAGSGGGR
jgi:hypothetical protein